jgi:hypothetical protein
VPSQNGDLAERLQQHIAARFGSVNSTFVGVKSEPLCEPSHQGWFFD